MQAMLAKRKTRKMLRKKMQRYKMRRMKLLSSLKTRNHRLIKMAGKKRIAICTRKVKKRSLNKMKKKAKKVMKEKKAIKRMNKKMGKRKMKRRKRTIAVSKSIIKRKIKLKKYGFIKTAVRWSLKLFLRRSSMTNCEPKSSLGTT